MLYTPHIGKSWLWETSGHLGFYAENMYAPLAIDEVDYYLKPMNCPFHILIYKSQACAPTATCRCAGPSWARSTATSAPACCTACCACGASPRTTRTSSAPPSRSRTRSSRCCASRWTIWKALRFRGREGLPRHPAGQGAVGEPARWDQATASLKKAIEREALAYALDEGGGAFYGPKIDLKIKDALGREWQMTTIQFDFNLPERFDMTFAANDGSLQRPYMVHRALLGSLERFFGVLIEHYGGAFPVWLAPVQVLAIPVAPAFNEYAQAVVRGAEGPRPACRGSTWATSG